jgi:G2/mitotic-specific cyclin 2
LAAQEKEPQVIEEVREEVEIEVRTSERGMEVDHAPPVQRRGSTRKPHSTAAAPRSATRSTRRHPAPPPEPEAEDDLDEDNHHVSKKRRTSSEAGEEERRQVEDALNGADEPTVAPGDGLVFGAVEADPNGDDWEDLDAEDADDPQMVSEYVVEIFDYLKEVEVCVRQGT